VNQGWNYKNRQWDRPKPSYWVFNHNIFKRAC